MTAGGLSPATLAALSAYSERCGARHDHVPIAAVAVGLCQLFGRRSARALGGRWAQRVSFYERHPAALVRGLEDLARCAGGDAGLALAELAAALRGALPGLHGGGG